MYYRLDLRIYATYDHACTRIVRIRMRARVRVFACTRFLYDMMNSAIRATLLISSCNAHCKTSSAAYASRLPCTIVHYSCNCHARVRATHAPSMREARARQCGVTAITRSTIVHRYLTGPIEYIQARRML